MLIDGIRFAYILRTDWVDITDKTACMYYIFDKDK